MKKNINKILTQIRYFLWGKQIREAMEKAEYAGSEFTRSSFVEEIRKRDMKIKELRDSIEQRAISRLSELTFSVDPTKVVSAVSDRAGNAAVIKLGEEELTLQEVKNLKEEVRWFRNSKIHEIFQNTLKHKAQDIMFRKSESYDDMKSGKMCLLNIDIQENILKAIETFDTKKR